MQPQTTPMRNYTHELVYKNMKDFYFIPCEYDCPVRQDIRVRIRTKKMSTYIKIPQRLSSIMSKNAQNSKLMGVLRGFFPNNMHVVAIKKEWLREVYKINEEPELIYFIKQLEKLKKKVKRESLSLVC